MNNRITYLSDGPFISWDPFILLLFGGGGGPLPDCGRDIELEGGGGGGCEWRAEGRRVLPWSLRDGGGGGGLFRPGGGGGGPALPGPAPGLDDGGGGGPLLLPCGRKPLLREVGGGGGGPPPLEDGEGGGGPPPLEDGGGGGWPPPLADGGGGGGPQLLADGGGGGGPPLLPDGGGGGPPFLENEGVGEGPILLECEWPGGGGPAWRKFVECDCKLLRLCPAERPTVPGLVLWLGGGGGGELPGGGGRLPCLEGWGALGELKVGGPVLGPRNCDGPTFLGGGGLFLIPGCWGGGGPLTAPLPEPGARPGGSIGPPAGPANIYQHEQQTSQCNKLILLTMPGRVSEPQAYVTVFKTRCTLFPFSLL